MAAPALDFASYLIAVPETPVIRDTSPPLNDQQHTSLEHAYDGMFKVPKMSVTVQALDSGKTWRELDFSDAGVAMCCTHTPHDMPQIRMCFAGSKAAFDAMELCPKKKCDLSLKKKLLKRNQ